MPKAKKWVLLANASDDSMIKNKLVFDLAAKMNFVYVPALEYVDLWIDGDYRGTYTIGEKVEIDDNRLNLIDAEGLLLEYDEAFYEEEDISFVNEILNKHFTVKESVSEREEDTLNGVRNFQEKLTVFMKFLYQADLENVTLNDLQNMIDVDSFAQYYLINEYVLNKEAVVTSFYWYLDGADDILHVGPIWDFDTCMNFYGDESYEEYYITNHRIFEKLLSIPAFQSYVQEIYDNHLVLFDALTGQVDILYGKINGSCIMNYTRWNTLGTENPKGGKFADTFSDAIEEIYEWLDGRKNSFEVVERPRIICYVDENNAVAYLKYFDNISHENLRFAVWSEASGQADLKWYEAKQDGMGAYVANFSLDNLSATGCINIHVYDRSGLLTGSWSWIDEINCVALKVTAVVSEDCKEMQIVLENAEGYKKVWFPVWSVEDGQDDIQWYAAKKQADGDWVCDVDLREHQSAGEYQIHVYAGDEKPETLIAHTQANVEFIAEPMPKVTAVVSEDCKEMQIVLENAEGYKKVWFPVWSVEDGQDDIQWYAAKKQADGDWVCDVDLREHQPAGEYQIHVYAGGDSPEELIAYRSIYV